MKPLKETAMKFGLTCINWCPGDDIQAVIDVYIKKAEVVVLIWSLQAFASEGVDAEIQTSKRLGKRIIPLLKDATPLSHHKELKGFAGYTLR